MFEDFRPPHPIPEDLYVKTDFENDLDWVIASQKNTGGESCYSSIQERNDLVVERPQAATPTMILT